MFTIFLFIYFFLPKIESGSVVHDFRRSFNSFYLDFSCFFLLNIHDVLVPDSDHILCRVSLKEESVKVVDNDGAT